MNIQDFQRLEMNGGNVEEGEDVWRFELPPVSSGYGDAQVHDYGRFPLRRHTFPWSSGTRLTLEARFSHDHTGLLGTAGFGFWNAPFADPSLKWPALPQATWFFFASKPNDLPLAATGPGRGWFAATLDATTPQALAWAPAAPVVLFLNQFPGIRQRLWPKVQQSLGISFTQLDVDLQAWQRYELVWQKTGCRFTVNGNTVLDTPFSPRGPLGFVCWIDNQFMVVKANGRFRWGTLTTTKTQWMEIKNLSIESAN
ncbi:MAG: hypothetical protein DWQ04_02805 [Chloroflexi bacterium]|nr:MAG: hypothetical protein DWQ04_02805 [Chloroflexota bacterium]